MGGPWTTRAFRLHSKDDRKEVVRRFCSEEFHELTQVIKYYSGGHVKRRSWGLGDKSGIQVIRWEGTLQWRRGDLD